MDKKVVITTSGVVDKDIKTRIKSLFENDEIKFKEDSKLIGGIKIRKGNELFDGTIKHHLETLKNKLYNLDTYDR
jgi:F0F1-type ATP synthase delta subunit